MNKETKIIDIIKRLATTDKSTEDDSTIMQLILRKLGHTNAIVTCGIVYLDGRGTIKNPPTSIHTIAKALLPSCK